MQPKQLTFQGFCLGFMKSQREIRDVGSGDQEISYLYKNIRPENSFNQKVMIRSSAPINTLLINESFDSSLSKLEGVTLLLVEDNLVNQHIVKAILKKWNITVEVANNGLEGFEKSKNKDYDIILMDTHMPVMDGFEAIKKIRNELDGFKRLIPIISFSASMTEVEKGKVFEAGANSLVEKPFKAENLHSKIKELIQLNKLSIDTQIKIAS